MRITKCPNCKSKEFYVTELQTLSAKIEKGTMTVLTDTVQSDGFQKIYCATDKCNFDADVSSLDIDIELV